VIEKIVELKQENKWYGVKRISQALRRVFFLQASHETVRKTLHEAALMEKPPKLKRNMTRPRFFERATPNQMWQSDIFTFKLGGKYAYIVAFMDDYSRYIVSLELYRSPTSAAVIETYRKACGEYQPPKEMLTDRGRQYTSWRGKSRFAVELQKDHVAHIVSRPQHPMTLGKAERFWSTMWRDFLGRAQFESFESARERLRMWVKYYNHRRPNQGLEGMCPADRYFEVLSELKKTIQAGIEENLLEMALRGAPKAPFYLVGRMEGQSVVLTAEKGKLKLSVDDKELSYDIEKGNGQNLGGNSEQEKTSGDSELYSGAESAGSAGNMDRPGEAGGSDEDDEDQLHGPASLATPSDGGDAAGPRAPGEPAGRCGPESATAKPAGEEGGDRAEEPDRKTGANTGAWRRDEAAVEYAHHEREDDLDTKGGSDRESEGWTDECGPGGGESWGVTEDLLRVGEEGPAGNAAGPGGQAVGPAAGAEIAKGGDAGTAGEGTGREAAGGRTDSGDPRGTQAHGGSGR